MEHSRLLKFILPKDHDIKSNMAEPFKVKFEYSSPINVEAEVPGVQKIRRNSGSDARKAKRTISNTDMPSASMEYGRIIRRHSVNVNYAEDKTDEKKTHSKIPRFKQTVEKVQAQRRDSRDKESHIPIRRSSIPKLKINKTTNKPAKNNHNSIINVKKNVTEITAEDDFDKLYEEVVCSTPTPVNINVSLLNPKVEDPEKLESKFEEIIHNYDDNITPDPKAIVKPVIYESEQINKSSANAKATNSYKLQAVTEKVKKSKIPSLQRKKQQTVELRTGKNIATRDRVRLSQGSRLEDLNNNKELVSVNTATKEVKDIAEVNISINDEDTTEIIKTVTKTTDVVNSIIFLETKSKEAIELVENKTGHIIEEDIDYKSSIKIGIPIFDSCVHEYPKKIENGYVVGQTQAITVENGITTLEKIESIEINEFKHHPSVTEKTFEPKITETIDLSENNNDKTDELGRKDDQRDVKETKTGSRDSDSSLEDISKLRGKVGKLISKIDYHEPFDVNATKLEFGCNAKPKNKLVLSKIAMFERHNVEPEPKNPKNKLSKLIATNTLEIEHIHVHTPLIVEEVLKPLYVIENESLTSGEITANGQNNSTQITRAEMVVIETPEIVRYDVGNGIEVGTTLVIEPLKLVEEELTSTPRKIKSDNEGVLDFNQEEGIIEEKVLRPLPRKQGATEGIDKYNARDELRYTTKIESEDIMVTAPKYTPVREVLKRYESLNEQDVKKVAKDFPKVRQIKSEVIDDLKPDEYRRSLDELFVHQTRPASEILNDLKYENLEHDIASEVFLAEPAKLKEDPYHNNNKQTSDFTLKTYKSKDSTPAVESKTTKSYDNTTYNDVRPKYKSYKSSEPRKAAEPTFKSLDYIQDYHESKSRDAKRAKSLAELDLGNVIKGKVNKMIVRINSIDNLNGDVKEVVNPISIKEMPRKKSVLEKIALFENKLTPAKEVCAQKSPKQNLTEIVNKQADTEIQAKIIELSNAKVKYGKMEKIPLMELANGVMMPVLAVGTALMDPQLTFHVVSAAIDLGYRAIDTAHIYGNEKAVGEAIKAKIDDGTVTREELFVISKLWSTFHRSDLVERACDASLEAMGLQYFDLYLIHNPMSFKEGKSPMPRIATVLQYSEHDYLDAWFGMEALGTRARALGVSNFNSVQIRRVLDRARVKPVVNQVECHPYLSQQKLDNFCSERNITLSCFGVLGSKGTPIELTSGQPAAIDDPLVQVMASGLGVSPAQLLIRYQLQCGHNAVVKSSSAAHLWDNLQALTFNLTSVEVDALHALNRNKRIFVFRGMGDTHKNYPFSVAF